VARVLVAWSRFKGLTFRWRTGSRQVRARTTLFRPGWRAELESYLTPCLNCSRLSHGRGARGRARDARGGKKPKLLPKRREPSLIRPRFVWPELARPCASVKLCANFAYILFASVKGNPPATEGERTPGNALGRGRLIYRELNSHESRRFAADRALPENHPFFALIVASIDISLSRDETLIFERTSLERRWAFIDKRHRQRRSLM